MSAGSQQRVDDRFITLDTRHLQRSDTARVHCVNPGAVRQQRIDHISMSAQDREHQCGAAASIARVDIERGTEHGVHRRQIPRGCGIAQRLAALNR